MVLLWAQINKQGCFYELKKPNKWCFYELKRIYIFVVSIWGFCLKLLQVVLVSHLYLYLLWWSSCLKVTLVSISISTSSTVPACSIPIGYVHGICIMCLHVQFPKDMCTISNLYRIHACIFNSRRICAQFLYLDLLDYFLDERSIGDVGGLIGEYNFVEKCFGDDSDLPWSLDDVQSIEKE